MKTIIEYCEESKKLTINEIREENIDESLQIINEGLWSWFKKIWRKLTSRTKKYYDTETKKYIVPDDVAAKIEKIDLSKIKTVNVKKSAFIESINYLKGSKFYDKYVDISTKILDTDEIYYFEVLVNEHLIELIIIKKDDKDKFKCIYHEFLDISIDKDSVKKFNTLINKQLLDLLRKKYSFVREIDNFLKKED